MVLRIPSLRLGRSTFIRQSSPSIHPIPQICQSRSLFNWLRSRRTPQDSNPLDSSTRKATLPPASKSEQVPLAGDLAPSSIFEQDTSRDQQSTTSRSRPGTTPTPGAPRTLRRDPTLMAATLDPHPHARQRWERKMVIRSIHRRHRINKSTLLLRTERSSLSKSHFMATSIKKLGPIARQIAGKKIEDAIVQMRFSKKKVAGEVLKHLRYARDEAVVRRGMGLGGIGGVVSLDGRSDIEVGRAIEAGMDVASGEAGTPNVGDGEDVKTAVKEVEGGIVVEKNGKKRLVKDKTEIYVDQAWVGRGTYGRQADYRARGQVYSMRPPTTSISILLKEEATRIRLSREREEKRAKKKTWVPLPDRPITAQRQYCMW